MSNRYLHLLLKWLDYALKNHILIVMSEKKESQHMKQFQRWKEIVNLLQEYEYLSVEALA